MDRTIEETNALNNSRHFAYDAIGNLTSTTDRNGREREFEYDALHRLTDEHWLDGRTVVNTISFTYDAVGNLLTAADDFSAYTYTYDALNRATTVDNFGTPGVPNVVLTNTYDAISRRTSLSAEIGTVADFINNYEYDALSRMTRITQADGSPSAGYAIADKRVDLTYNLAGQFAGITRCEDLVGTALVAATTYAYDSAGRLTNLNHAKGATVLADYLWTFDDAGRITSFTSPDGTSTYAYDSTGQLTGADHTYQADEDYTYDANGNRTITGYVTGTNNLLLSDGTFDYEYDAEGNRTKKTDIATGEYVEYEWDHRNRLVSVSFRDSQGVLTKYVEFDYDLHDKLIGKRVDETGNGIFDHGQAFVYDQGQKGGLDDLVLVFDDTGSLTNRYLHGPAIDQVLADENAVADILWALNDNQGTVRDIAKYDALADQTTVANHRTFDSFGNITAESDPSVEFLFAYTGRYWDADVELQWNLARWYAPQTGRWLSEDPIGFDAGDASLSRYVGNAPTNFADPSGLSPWHPSGPAAGAYENPRPSGRPSAPALTPALTPTQQNLIRLCNGDPECERTIARLMTQIRRTPPRGWWSLESDKCHRWIDDFIARHYPQYNVSTNSVLTLPGGITLEFLHYSTRDPDGLVTARNTCAYIFGDWSWTTWRMYDHSFARVTFPDGTTAYFDLGHRTNQGHFGGEDHWWFGGIPWELDPDQGGAREPGTYD